MLTDSQIASRLIATPVPVPPANLLADLKWDLRLVRATPPPPQPRRRFTWTALRWPLTGLAGAAGLALLLVFLPVGGARSLAGAGDAIRRVRNLHVIHHERLGPPHPVQRDPAQPVNAWPNFSTSLHPANPLVRTDLHYEAPDQGPARWLTVRGPERTWNQRNWELFENRQTRERRFRLNSSPPVLEALVAPALDSLIGQFVPAPRIAASAEPKPEVALEGCWVGERRYPGVRMGEHTPVWSTRVWLDEAKGWVRRMEWWSDDYLAIPGGWVFQALEFQPLPEHFDRRQFEFDVRDSDLQPLGLTRAELSRLSASAFSAEFTGATNATVQILIQEPRQRRELTGRLPLVVVHDPADATEIQLRFTDDQTHPVGVRINGLNMSTAGRGLRVRVLPTGEAEANAVN